MKNFFILIICWIFSCILCILFFDYIENYNVIKSWYITTHATTNKSIAYLESNKLQNVNFSKYYLSANYREMNIYKSIEIATKSLQDMENMSDTKHKEREILATDLLLGQLYFYANQYALSTEHYWITLLKDKKNSIIRHNYELALKYNENHKNMSPQLSEFKKKLELSPINEIEFQGEIPLISIEKIITSSEYFYFIQERSVNTNKGW